MRYKVIWFDDQHRELTHIREKAALQNIDLIGFDNSMEGILELENNLLFYDAAIVDGIFFRKPGQSADQAKDDALGEVGRALERLSTTKLMPWFILSGQISFTNQTHDYARLFKNGKVYDKVNEDQLTQLWADLKREADRQQETQIRRDHYRVFTLFNDEFYGKGAAKSLLHILKKESMLSAVTNPESYFNSLRKVMENFFIACNKWGLLPDDFVNNGVALNESSKFLCGIEEKGYKLKQDILPPPVKNYLRNILNITQSASHLSPIDTYIEQINSPYLLYSTTYQVLDVLLWLNYFVDKNQNKEVNKNLYEKVDYSSEIEGRIEKDKDGNYHFEDILFSWRYITETGLKEGDLIRMSNISSNNNEKTNKAYSRFCGIIKKM